MSRKQSKRNQGNGKQDKGRFSSKRKTEVVLRLLPGEDLEALSGSASYRRAKSPGVPQRAAREAGSEPPSLPGGQA